LGSNLEFAFFEKKKSLQAFKITCTAAAVTFKSR
jgi:hypothetical protein